MRPDRIIRTIRKAGGRALVGLVGVQSNQFPRALDLAQPFLAAGIPVCIVSHHPKMSDSEWEEAYRMAWDTYYTPEHIRTILRRSAAVRIGRPETTLRSLVWFYVAAKHEGVHPLESGVVRLKFRRDRRHELPLEHPLVFYPRFLGESLIKLWHYWRMFRSGMAMLKKIENWPDRWTYSDLAIAPPQADEFDALDLYHATSGGEAALARKRRDEAIIAGANAAVRALDPA